MELTFAMNTRGPDGEPTAPGLFRVLPSTLRLPPGGEADVTVIVDTRASGPDDLAANQPRQVTDPYVVGGDTRRPWQVGRARVRHPHDPSRRRPPNLDRG